MDNFLRLPVRDLMDKDKNSFWCGIRKVNNAKIPLASTVENCVDELSICDMWNAHYESLLNSVQSCDLKLKYPARLIKIQRVLVNFRLQALLIHLSI